MILRVHIHGACSYHVGDEVWHESLAEVIYTEAETIACYAGPDLLGSPNRAHRDALRDRIVAEMTTALVSAGDQYEAPDGVRYSLVAEPTDDLPDHESTLSAVARRTSAQIVEEVLRFEDLPWGSTGSRRAIVRWSDGSEGDALTWYSDEILVCEGDLLGKTRAQLRSLHFRRDRDWLQS